MTDASDEHIASLVQQGNANAFGDLIERYEAKLRRYARKFLYYQEDIEDLVQDVFIRSYTYIQSFDTSKRFSPWIYRIAHNTFVNELKRKDRSRFIIFDTDTILPHVPAKETADQDALTSELKQQLDQAITALPAKYREVLILYYFEELSYQEISQVLRIPVGTVGVRINRARSKLKTEAEKTSVTFHCMHNLKQSILNKITSAEVDMKPRWHFVLQSLLLVSSIVFSALLTVYLLSFVAFFLRQSGVGLIPLGSLRGLSLFVMHSPWLLIGALLVLLGVLTVLVRKYSFSFQRPLAYSLVAITVLTLFGGYTIGQTRLHPRLHTLTQERPVPVVGKLYRDIHERTPEHITIGTIQELTDSGFVISSPEQELIEVILGPNTRRSPRLILEPEKPVVVFGERTEQTIRAFGVKPARSHTSGPKHTEKPRLKPRPHRDNI